MNNRVLKWMAVLLLILSIVFCGLWRMASRDTSQLEQLCQYSVSRACERFGDYRKTGSQYDYQYGVSELTSFYNSYTLLTVETTGSTNTDCTQVNQLLGMLMDLPELSGEALELLISATGELSRDIHDQNAYAQLLAVYHAITR